MKKLLYICDGEHLSQGVFKFIKSTQLNEQVLVKGLFFSEINARQLVPASLTPPGGPYSQPQDEETEILEIVQSSNGFTDWCKSVGIRHKVSMNFNGWEKEGFIKESRFADLALISDLLFCRSITKDYPNLRVKEALRVSECPVLVVPETFASIDRIVVAYDGKRESAFALKQFSNLFPQYADLPIEFVYLNEDEESVPDLDLLKEYTNAHFGAGNISKLHFHEGRAFSEWLRQKKNSLLISGSFSRTGASMLLRRSFVEDIIKNNEAAVFIAHNV
jgi:hypothetical protein